MSLLGFSDIHQLLSSRYISVACIIIYMSRQTQNSHHFTYDIFKRLLSNKFLYFDSNFYLNLCPRFQSTIYDHIGSYSGLTHRPQRLPCTLTNTHYTIVDRANLSASIDRKYVSFPKFHDIFCRMYVNPIGYGNGIRFSLNQWCRRFMGLVCPTTFRNKFIVLINATMRVHP